MNLKVEKKIKKEWKNPIVMELGVENTLCGDDSVDALPVHGGDLPNSAPGNSGKFICPHCGHGCSNEKQREDHIKRIHGLTVTAS